MSRETAREEPKASSQPRELEAGGAGWNCSSGGVIRVNGRRSSVRSATVVAEDRAFLHDEEHVLSLADVLDGITGNGHDIGELPGSSVPIVSAKPRSSASINAADANA